eukprot:CAMPEP_0194203358 /NCGR_PEP_ID=MMETSP0156-20130528/3171_1 /TAXON_ID=33649 /ORGANISM="Thalassionema nitzschioides, Strain L26-B" /LENGTH=674 /DNA_ID=CAMNT_0038929101 /DNA_START=105 /DNA_END=2129 /DNA_ORIENTATION=-
MGGCSEKRKHGLNLTRVFEDKESTYFEVEAVLDSRVQDGRVEYLVKWKGVSLSQATWEPSENLCESAIEEAKKLAKKKREENSITTLETGDNLMASFPEKPFGDDKSMPHPDFSVKKDNENGLSIVTEAMEKDDGSDPTKEPKEKNPDLTEANLGIKMNASLEYKPASPPRLEDGRWYWTDEEQVNFREPDRINVNNPDARQKITDARLSGTPVVLVGHVGWANFAKKWIVPVNHTTADEKSDWLDLSLDHKLDLDGMIADIGQEMVPLLQENYNEHDPLQSKAEMTVKTFLKTYWPDDGGKCYAQERLYLHQWQFPLSDDAGMKLCHKNNPLPNNIYGEDLLKYWLDLPQCKYDNPLQYLFMGRDGTMSKLHCDNGGLDISIAPVIGIKECILVHRSDDETCLYNLDAKVDDINLQMYPLMTNTRIWKTCIKPGEILLMPQGTYHQCRNVTPCLSYSRFHLDCVNLLPFLQSMMNGDADEIEHSEILWNSSTELINAVDDFVDSCKSCLNSIPPKSAPLLDHGIIEKVETLRSLRNFSQEIVRRLEAPGESRKLRRHKKVGKGKKCYAIQHWIRLIDEIDDSLHHFRHRAQLDTPARIRRKIFKPKIFSGESCGQKGEEGNVNEDRNCTSKHNSCKVECFEDLQLKGASNNKSIIFSEPSRLVRNYKFLKKDD